MFLYTSTHFNLVYYKNDFTYVRGIYMSCKLLINSDQILMNSHHVLIKSHLFVIMLQLFVTVRIVVNGN